MKESKYKNKMIVYPTDYVSVVTDDSGEEFCKVDIWSYCRFFAENIQLKVSENQFDGISLEKYAEKVECNQMELLKKLTEFTEDGRICDFQLDMQEYHKVTVNAWALCNLCLFINEIIGRKLVVLLKPTIIDILEDVTELDSITFTNKDESSCTSRNSNLKYVVLSAMKKSSDSLYETERIANRKDVFTKELMQIEFFYYLSLFFNQFFKIKRRGELTTEESSIIGYFLKWFGLSPTIVSSSRLRQLRMGFKYVGTGDLYQIPVGDKLVTVQWTFIKYKDWKHGKINPLKQEIEPLSKSDSIKFGSDTIGFDLLKR